MINLLKYVKLKRHVLYCSNNVNYINIHAYTMWSMKNIFISAQYKEISLLD